HLIGGLQRNKVRAAARAFDYIHTIDRVELARALGAEVAGRPRPLPVLIQVNATGEPAKRGTAVEGAAAVAQAILETPGPPLHGLMTIRPPRVPPAPRPP